MVLTTAECKIYRGQPLRKESSLVMYEKMIFKVIGYGTTWKIRVYGEMDASSKLQVQYNGRAPSSIQRDKSFLVSW
jgi:hypothetical protein